MAHSVDPGFLAELASWLGAALEPPGSR